MKKKTYLNLTNGLEWLEEDSFLEKYDEFEIVRIQSSHCEAKAWNKLLLDLDYGFLLDLATSGIVEIYDTSSKKDMSRALFQGIEVIKYVLTRRWLGIKPEKVYVRGNDSTKYFEWIYDRLSEEVKKKLDYVKKFLNPELEEIRIDVVCKTSLHDGDFEYFKKLLLGETE